MVKAVWTSDQVDDLIDSVLGNQRYLKHLILHPNNRPTEKYYTELQDILAVRSVD